MNEGPNIRAVETTGSEPADDRLMAVLAAGQMYPLAELYTRYGRAVRATIRRFAPEISAAEAEELGQDVFLAAAQSAGRFKPGHRLKPWLAGIAVNKARGWRRATWLRRKLLKRHHRDPVGLAAGHVHSFGIFGGGRNQNESVARLLLVEPDRQIARIAANPVRDPDRP